MSTSIDLGITCSDCTTSSHGIPKLFTGPSSDQHCSGFEIFPDFSHISVFPVNCSARYRSRILCEKNGKGSKENGIKNKDKEYMLKGIKSGQSGTEDQGSKFTRAYSRYYIANNTLCEMQYVCPRGYHIYIHDLRIKLVLNQMGIIRYNQVNASTCKTDNFVSEVRIEDNINLRPVYRLLEEYYTSGADIVTGRKANNNDLYSWLPPSLYPTYIPCFTKREQTENVISITMYTCEDGSIIPDAEVCNGNVNCINAEDERDCKVCSEPKYEACFNNCLFPTCMCNMFYFQCEGGGCVHYDQVCDNFADCPGEDDEIMCYNKKLISHFDEQFIKESHVIGICNPLFNDLLMCRSKPQCYNSSAICHYDHSGGAMAHCEDGSHLGSSSLCQYIECTQHYKCLGSYCIPTRKICDGVIDCPVGDDEASCEAYSCPGHM